MHVAYSELERSFYLCFMREGARIFSY